MRHDQTDSTMPALAETGASSGLSRRDAVRGLVIAAVSPLFAVVACRDAADVGGQVRAGMPPAPGEMRTLSPTQNSTVTAMAEVILPETDTAGAASLRINEFIDLLLTDWVDDDDRASFLRAIDSIDRLAEQRFGSAFADCTAVQQADMVRDLDTPIVEMATKRRQWEEDRAQQLLEAARTGTTPPRIIDVPSDPSTYAFYQLKSFVMTGYFTSEVGLQMTGFHEIPGRWDGCVEIAGTADAGEER